MKQKIVIFDFDNTLINGDSILIAAWFASNKFNIFFRFIKIIPYFLLFKCSIINPKRFKEIFLENFKICDYFNRKDTLNYLKKIKKIINIKALKRLKRHKINNEKIILCSASPFILVNEIASYLKVDLICTELYEKNNNYYPKIKGNNCNGYEKVVRLKKYLGEIDNFSLEVYGDSLGDKELLDLAEIPHYRSFDNLIKIYPKKRNLRSFFRRNFAKG